MNHPDFIAEARRRLERLLPAEQVTAWLEQVERLGAVLTLPIGDGVPFAVHPPKDAPLPPPRVRNDQV